MQVRRDVYTVSVRCFCKFKREGDTGSILFAIGSRVPWYSATEVSEGVVVSIFREVQEDWITVEMEATISPKNE